MQNACPALAETLAAKAAVSRGLEREIAALRRLSPPKRCAEIAFFLSLWAAGAALALFGKGLPLAVGIAMSAVALNAVILLMHEGMHQTLFASPFWNRLVSVLLGTAFLMSFTAYQVMHLRHHDYLGDPRDPDDYHNYTGHAVLVWILHFVRLLIGPPLYLLLIPILALRHGDASQRRRVAVEYLWLSVAYAAILKAAPSGALLVAWLLPLWLAGQMTAVRGLTQHAVTDAADPYIASRSIQAHPLVAFCLLNENYHLEHHLFPEIPSYSLQRLHLLVQKRLPYVVTGPSYLNFLARFLRAASRFDETPIGLKPGEFSSRPLPSPP